MIQASEVREQLEQILRSDGFCNAVRLSRLLRFIVEAALEGRSGDLKEYTLGAEVFERGPDFDPRVDTLVRSTARHLRFKLDAYYKSQGQSDAVVVELPKGGYVPVFRRREGHPSKPPQPQAPPTRIRKRAAAAAGMAAVTLAAAYLIYARPAPAPNSVAVLPFENRTGRAADQYLVDGISEDLTDSLVRIPDLRVVARTSAVAAGKRADDIHAIGRDLQVAAVLTGSVETSGPKMRISARLWNARDGRLLWSAAYDTAAADTGTVDREIVEATAVRLEASVRGRAATADTTDPEAHDLYIRGRYLWYQRDEESLWKSVRLFQQAVAKDPGYVLAYSGLADAYGVLGGNNIAPPEGVLPLAEAAAARALALSPDSASVHSSLGLIKNAEWDWTGAERELRRALQLNPGYAPTYQRLALNATVHRRFEEAESLLRRAQTLDPLNWMLVYNLGENAYYARRFDEAIAWAHQVQAKGAAANLLHRAWFHQGHIAEALAVLEDEHSFSVDIDRLTLEPNRAAAAGRLRRMLSDPHQRVAPCFIATSAARLGDKELAFEWLEKAYAAHDPDLASLGVEPDLDPIRDDPRFRELLKKVGL